MAMRSSSTAMSRAIGVRSSRRRCGATAVEAIGPNPREVPNMTVTAHRPVLLGQRALVVGIANEYSIAYGCARAFRELGAELAITYLNERARPHVKPLAETLQASVFMPLDVAT